MKFIEWLGKHPLAAGIFGLIGVISFGFSIYTYIEGNLSSQNQVQKLQNIESNVTSQCAIPPCATKQQALSGLTGYTKDFLDKKFPLMSSKDEFGAHYVLEDCRISVHIFEEVVRYYSFPVDKKCPFSWKSAFWLDRELSPDKGIKLSDLFNSFGKDGVPDIEIAEGCFNCGNKHEGYLEFVISGPHVSNFYDRYFTISSMSDFYWKLRDELENNYPRGSTNDLENFCSVSITQSIKKALLLDDPEIESVGFGYFWRPNYKPDICINKLNENFVD